MKTLILLLLLCGTAIKGLATPPMSPEPLDKAFETFQKTMPAHFKELITELKRRVPRSDKDDHLKDWMEGMEQCLTVLNEDDIPNLRRAFAANKRPEDMLEELDKIVITVEDFRWSLDMFLARSTSKKILVFVESLTEMLEAFWFNVQHYTRRFGWMLRQDIRHPITKKQ